MLNFPAPEDRRVWTLATAAQRAGTRVTVVSPALRGHRPGRGEQDGVALRWFAAVEGRGAVGAVLEAAQVTAAATLAVLRERPGPGDVVHVCTPPDTLAPLLRLLRRRGVGTLYDQHDVVPLLAADKPAHRRLVPAYEAMERATVRAADSVVTAGQVQADRLTTLYAVAPSVVRTAAPLAVGSHVAPQRANLLGYLGVLGEQDGVDRLVRAVPLLPGDVTVEVAGDGPELARLQALAVELGVADRVRFLGWLDATDLDGFVDRVHGLVVPDPVTPFNDSCPMLKVSHALAAGVPVVLTPLRENLALTGGLGFVAAGDEPAELADAIAAWAASDAAERAAQGERLRDRWRSELEPTPHLARYVEAVAHASSAGLARKPAPGSSPRS